MYLCIMIQELWRTIPSNHRGRAVWVAVTIFMRALLNFVGVAMMVPLLVIILDSDSITTIAPLREAYNILGMSSYESFALVVCAAIVGVIILKNLVVLALYRYERDYIYGLYSTLSKRLFMNYYNQGLHFIKHNNSALLTRNVNVVSLMFVAGVLKPIATIIGEVVLLVMLFVALACYSPTVALFALVALLPIMAIFYIAVRRRLNNLGTMENEAQRTKSRIVAECFRGYADIEIGGAFNQVLKRFDKAMGEVVALRKRSSTLSMLPQIFTEVGLTVALVVLLIISLYSSTEDMGLLFGIFAVAAVRLIPSMRNILTSWSTLRLNNYSIETMAEAESFTIPEQENTSEPLILRHSVVLDDICFKFEDSDKPIIANLNMEIRRGERVGIRGASGVGKTTLFNLLLGLYTPTAGRILVDGKELDASRRRMWQNNIGYVSQQVFIADMTLAENIALGVDSKDIDPKRLDEAIDRADLRSFIDSLPKGVESRIGEQGCRISGGQRQRIGIARALYKGCDILLFDEATSSLDSHTEENINNAIRRLSDQNNELTIVVIAHRESSLEYCDRIITLE